MATMPLGTGAELSTGQRAACQYHNLLQKTTSMGSGGSRTEDRRYDAGAGRFISEDFIKGHTAVPYAMNHYSYCFNRPMDLVDLNGMWPSLKDFGNGIESTISSVVETVSDVSCRSSKIVRSTAEYVLFPYQPGTYQQWRESPFVPPLALFLRSVFSFLFLSSRASKCR